MKSNYDALKEDLEKNKEDIEIAKLEELFIDFKGELDDYKLSIDWENPVGKEVC